MSRHKKRRRKGGSRRSGVKKGSGARKSQLGKMSLGCVVLLLLVLGAVIVPKLAGWWK